MMNRQINIVNQQIQ